MKTMTCAQLGGACELELHATTFEEIAELSKKHGIEMFISGDKAHIDARTKMQEMSQSPDAMKKWFDEKRKKFDALPTRS
jgi:predicted small metal-binding protein